MNIIPIYLAERARLCTAVVFRKRVIFPVYCVCVCVLYVRWWYVCVCAYTMRARALYYLCDVCTTCDIVLGGYSTDTTHRRTAGMLCCV